MSDHPTTDDAETESDPATARTGDGSAADAEAHRRRTIIRLLVGLGVGIPILVELATFVGLVEQSLFGDDGDGSGGGADGSGGGGDGGQPGGDRTPSDVGVGVDDELLPGTPQRETLSVASFRAGDDSWVLTLVASVENTGPEPYTIVFGPVTTENDRRVEGSSRPVTVASGETAQVTGTWQLPPGSRPGSVELRTAVDDAEPTAHEVELARIPVEGR
ncbi:hypothetical protein [Salinigranum sp. GCM10025319]|uniref:hypothetical protein n=1 Tax=Salinigranum sp. GCM10025319 TaxID=3252687 RepID=UPI00360B9438